MQTKIERQLRFLQCYCVLITLIAGGLLMMGATSQSKQKFAEIDVERINIVEKDGKLKMVISNQEREPDVIVEGKEFKGARSVGKRASILFFNERGDEVGGLSMAGSEKDGKYVASSGLTLDKYRSGETAELIYEDENGQYRSGLRVSSRSGTGFSADLLEKYLASQKTSDTVQKKAIEQKMQEALGGANRLFAGVSTNKNAVLDLRDANGNPRIQMTVTPAGESKIEFLDNNGKTLYSIPEQKSHASKK